MSSSKKGDLERYFAAFVNLSEAPSLPRLFSLGGRAKLLQNMVSTTQHPPPLTATHCLYVYTVLWQQRSWGNSNQRAGERGNSWEYRSQSWVENTNMTECTQEFGYLQPVNSDKHLRIYSPFTGQTFVDDDIRHWLPSILSFYAYTEYSQNIRRVDLKRYCDEKIKG